MAKNISKTVSKKSLLLYLILGCLGVVAAGFLSLQQAQKNINWVTYTYIGYRDEGAFSADDPYNVNFKVDLPSSWRTERYGNREYDEVRQEYNTETAGVEHKFSDGQMIYPHDAKIEISVLATSSKEGIESQAIMDKVRNGNYKVKPYDHYNTYNYYSTRTWKGYQGYSVCPASGSDVRTEEEKNYCRYTRVLVDNYFITFRDQDYGKYKSNISDNDGDNFMNNLISSMINFKTGDKHFQNEAEAEEVYNRILSSFELVK